MLYEWTVTAPDANDDLAEGQKEIQESTRPRVMKLAAMSGGTAAFDSVVEFSCGGSVVRIQNGKTGDTIVDHTEYKDVGMFPIPANKKLVARLVTDGGNNITLGVCILEL